MGVPRCTAHPWRKGEVGKAIEEYLKTKKVKDGRLMCACVNCGYVVNVNFPGLGASPDFLVFDSTEAKSFRIAEVKFPVSKKDININEACEEKISFRKI